MSVTKQHETVKRDAETQPRMRHYLETCCGGPVFRTLCGIEVVKDSPVMFGFPTAEHCAVCVEIARTPYFCRRCGQRFGL